MREIAAILEDNADRLNAMRACLRYALPAVEAAFFENAAEMITWFRTHFEDVALISLDHDLPLKVETGRTIDCGTGRQVADYLASELPTCPVIVHSSNDPCARGMFQVLSDAGWPCRRVYPCDDTKWIADAWLPEIQSMVSDGWIVFRP